MAEMSARGLAASPAASAPQSHAERTWGGLGTAGARVSRTVAAARTAAFSGGAAGGVRILLRSEGFFVLAASVAAYAQLGAGWGAFAMLFLLPDLAFFGYLAGPRVGALAYNATHSYIGAVGLLAIGAVGETPAALAAGLIWCAHIGFDRALGYGLKYAEGFHATHLGRIGRADPW